MRLDRPKEWGRRRPTRPTHRKRREEWGTRPGLRVRPLLLGYA